jgi:hypothetical protein
MSRFGLNVLKNWLSAFHVIANKSVSAHWLGIFRIAFFSHLLLMWFYHVEYKELLHGEFWNYSYTQDTISFILTCWLISLIGLISGTLTKICAVFNFICVVMICDISKQSYISSYYDDIMKSVSLIAIFTPIHYSYSIDKIIFKLKSQTTNLTYFVYIICTLGLMYTAAGIAKLFSVTWLKGMGLWLPLSLPHASWNRLPELVVEFDWLLKGTNYFIMGWELFFIPLIIWRKTRLLTCIIGVLFHISVMILFFLPKTALGVIPLYLLLVPFMLKPASSTFSLNLHTPSYTKTIYAIIIIYLFAQSYVTAKYVRYLIIRRITQETAETQSVNVNKRKIRLKFNSLSNAFLGVNTRSVFTDKQLLKQKLLIGVTIVKEGQEEWLPWISKDGLVSNDLTINGGWSKIMQHVLWVEEDLDAKQKNQYPSAKGFERALRYWMKKNEISDSNTHFNIYVRTCEVPSTFEKGFLIKQKNIPWQVLGSAKFEKGQFSATFK